MSFIHAHEDQYIPFDVIQVEPVDVGEEYDVCVIHTQVVPQSLLHSNIIVAVVIPVT